MRNLARVLAATALIAALAGCVVAPVGRPRAFIGLGVEAPVLAPGAYYGPYYGPGYGRYTRPGRYGPYYDGRGSGRDGGGYRRW